MPSDLDGPYRTPQGGDPDEPPPDPRGPWVLQTWTSRRDCPDCALQLFAARKEGFRIDACGRCGGAWVDARTLARAIDERSLVPAILSEQASRSAPAPGPDRPGRSCPECNAALVVRTVTRTRVVIDVCSEHGAWFDANEMRATIEALAPLPRVDPSVDRIIEEEARRGALRPPASYNVGYGLASSSPDLEVDALFVELYRAIRPRK